MRLVFLIRRIVEYQMLAPVVDAALAQGWNVECWHDTWLPGTGPKGYLFPELSRAPKFYNGQAAIFGYDDRGELEAAINQRPPDAIVAMRAPGGGEPAAPTLAGCLGRPDAGTPVWVMVQHGFDTLLSHTPAELLAPDLVAVYSRWWIDWVTQYFDENPQIDRPDEFDSAFEARALSVGFPDLDAAARIDPVEVRRRWGVPRDKPVVVLLPFGRGFGREAFWPSMICGQPSRLRRAANVLAYGRFEYWSEVWHDRTDAAVVRAVRAFCDRNEAYLLVKSRRKTPIPAYLRAVADKCLYDEQFYPSTILEALSIADVNINFYSTVVTEAVSLGVPNVCVTFSLDDYCGGNQRARERCEYILTEQEGGPFQFAGVSTAMSIAEAVEVLPRKTLDEFKMDPVARQQYLMKYVGPDDRRSAERVVEKIRLLMTERQSGLLMTSK